EALPILWDEGSGAAQSSATIAGHLEAGLTAKDAYAFRKEGDGLGAIQGAPKKSEAGDSTPFLGQGTQGRGECRGPSKTSEPSLSALSEQSGIPLDKCEVYRHDLGGGFGRRGGNQDYVRQAVNIDKRFTDVPCEMVWSA